MDAPRRFERTPFAVAESASAALLLGATTLPWFDRGSGGFVDRLSAWNAVDGGILLVAPAFVVVATALAGLMLPNRSKWSNPIAFALALGYPTVFLFAPGTVDYAHTSAFTSAYGLWLEVAAGVAGLAISLADLRLAGPSTRFSRFVPTSVGGYLVAALVVLAGVWGAAAQIHDAVGFSVAIVVLLLVCLGAPVWPLRVLIGLLAWAVAEAAFIAESQPFAVAGGVAFVAGIVIYAGVTRRGGSRPFPPSDRRPASSRGGT